MALDNTALLFVGGNVEDAFAAVDLILVPGFFFSIDEATVRAGTSWLHFDTGGWSFSVLGLSAAAAALVLELKSKLLGKKASSSLSSPS